MDKIVASDKYMISYSKANPDNYCSNNNLNTNSDKYNVDDNNNDVEIVIIDDENNNVINDINDVEIVIIDDENNSDKYDQYYTRPEVARDVITTIIKEIGSFDRYDYFVEPSAGMGALYYLLPDGKRLGIEIDSVRNFFVASGGNGTRALDGTKKDLFSSVLGTGSLDGTKKDQKRKEFVNADFLEITDSEFDTYIGHDPENVVVVGNPPFGKNCSLAIAFINRCAYFSHTICMILPATFNKMSIQKQINLNFHLAFTKDLEEDSFIFEGSVKNVPSV